jgi:hypothetical protein
MTIAPVRGWRVSAAGDRTRCATRTTGAGDASRPSFQAHHFSVLDANPCRAQNTSTVSPLARHLAIRCFQTVRASAIERAMLGHDDQADKTGDDAPVTKNHRTHETVDLHLSPLGRG